jgi:hypothetical protein
LHYNAFEKKSQIIGASKKLPELKKLMRQGKKKAQKSLTQFKMFVGTNIYLRKTDYEP